MRLRSAPLAAFVGYCFVLVTGDTFLATSSPELRQVDVQFKWGGRTTRTVDADVSNRWIANTRNFAPKTTMSHHQRNADKRVLTVAYLKSLQATDDVQ